MTHEFDPDDNFGHAFEQELDVDDDAAIEALLWQLLLLINPGDEESAQQQFAALQDAQADASDETGLLTLLRDAIDWRSGFFVADDAPDELIDAMEQLAARWNLRIDWGFDDEADEARERDPDALLQTAFNQLREHHYTVWLWETGEEQHAGWMTLQQDDAALRAVAAALGLHVRTAAA